MTGALGDDYMWGDLGERLRSEQQIREVMLRYCRGVDRADEELTRSAYHADATDDHGEGPEPAAEFARRVNEAHARRWGSTMHVVANHLAQVTGDAAAAETYVVAYLRRLDSTGVDVVGGRYLDRLERREGIWKIARRVYVCEWSALMPSGESLIDAGHYAQGQRGPLDPSYPLLAGA